METQQKQEYKILKRKVQEAYNNMFYNGKLKPNAKINLYNNRLKKLNDFKNENIN